MKGSPAEVVDVSAAAAAAAEEMLAACAAAGVGLWAATWPGPVLALPPATATVLGIDAHRRPASVADLLSLVPEPDHAAVNAAFAALDRTRGAIDFECRVLGASGEPRWFRWRGAPAGAIDLPLIRGTVQDITELKQAREEHERSRAEQGAAMARVSAVLEAMPDLWFVLGQDGRYLEVSRADHPALALPWDVMCGRSLADVVPPPVAALVAAALVRARASGEVERIEYRLTTRSGAHRAFEARIVAMADGRWLCLTRDITDTQQAQQALRESEARYARVVRGTSDGLWDWDLRSGHDHLSPRWKALLGFAPDELPDAEASFFDRIHPDDAGCVRAALQAHFEHGAPYDVELRLRVKGGEYRWFRSRGEAERDAAGKPLRMAGSIADITTRKQIEDALRDSQARFSAMFRTAPVGIALTTADEGIALEVNAELGRILGWPANEMVGRSSAELGVWPDPKQRGAFIAQLRSEGRAALPETVMRHRSGHAVHARLAAEAMQLGDRVLVLSAITDVSDRHAAEQALREQREAFEGIFRAASDAIVSVDEQGRILMFSPGAERIFQRPASALQGVPIDLLLPPAQRARHGSDIAGFARATASRRAMGAGRVKGLRADGQELDLEASISRTTVAGRTVLTAILRDVTEQVRAEAAGLRHRLELSALTRQLMAQEQVTTQRLAQALHDQLGQTLTALRLLLDRDRRAPAAAAEAAQRREQTGALVDEAIREVRQVLVELRPPLLAEEGLYAALDNEIRARTALHPQLDLLLEASPAAQHARWPGEVEYAVFMIAREALDNALRHADATLVRVALDCDASGAQLEVVDDGAGMAPGAERERPGHLGLVGMRERARAIGARLAIGTPAEGGTRVALAWAGAA